MCHACPFLLLKIDFCFYHTQKNQYIISCQSSSISMALNCTLICSQSWTDCMLFFINNGYWEFLCSCESALDGLQSHSGRKWRSLCFSKVHLPYAFVFCSTSYRSHIEVLQDERGKKNQLSSPHIHRVRYTSNNLLSLLFFFLLSYFLWQEKPIDKAQTLHKSCLAFLPTQQSSFPLEKEAHSQV